MKYRNAWTTYEGFQCSLLEVEQDSRTDLRNQDDHQEHEKLRRKTGKNFQPLPKWCFTEYGYRYFVL
jgi:hypothetical protein